MTDVQPFTPVAAEPQRTPTLFQFKVVVGGPFAAGKTTFIQHISQSEVVGTEARTSGAEAKIKDSTTVGMEYGTFSISEEDLHVQLLLFGVPGQDRFSFMWDIVSDGMDALLLVVDATNPGAWEDALRVGAHIRGRHAAPVVVAVNRADQVVGAVEAVRDRVPIPGAEYLACNVIDASEARNTLIVLLSMLLEELDQASGGEEQAG